MIERDYIMRMIAQLSAVLAKVLFAKQAGQYQEAGQLIQKSYEELFGLSAELLDSLDAETLAGLFGEREKMKALATLLREEGDVFAAQKEEMKSRQRYAKSLGLFQRLLPTDDAAIRDAVSALQSKLGAMEK